jgi:hypothetical protein
VASFASKESGMSRAEARSDIIVSLVWPPVSNGAFEFMLILCFS